MAKLDDYLDYEEDYLPSGKRESRKERRESRAKDHSKYKKTDQAQKRVEEPPLGGNYRRGRILNISPEIITVASDHETFICSLKGVLKKERTKQKNLIAVGDFVHFEVKSIDSGVISHVEKRSSFLAESPHK